MCWNYSGAFMDGPLKELSGWDFDMSRLQPVGNDFVYFALKLRNESGQPIRYKVTGQKGYQVLDPDSTVGVSTELERRGLIGENTEKVLKVTLLQDNIDMPRRFASNLTAVPLGRQIAPASLTSGNFFFELSFEEGSRFVTVKSPLQIKNLCDSALEFYIEVHVTLTW